ncbi:MAG: AMP-binding protein, partial [Niabella sp.]|nr:AMP-binding protein [Niabella sp.]
TILQSFNNNRVDFGGHTHILELIASQVARNGSATAVVYEQQALSYETLWERSGQLCNYLSALGVGREVAVAVLVNRGFNMLVSMLAVLRAGGAYVPLEPAHPVERLRYMLEDTGATIVLTDYAQSERLADVAGLRLVDIEELEPLLSQYPAIVPEKNISGKDLGYIIYTSGSTGRPKGVMIAHAGILNMVQSHIRILSLTPGLRILQFASYGFDGSCQEIFNTLCSGGTLIVASPAEILSASLLGELLERERVDIATLPPSYQILLKEQLGSLKVLYSAGEALHAEVAGYLQTQGVEVVNGYGPTENTVTVTLSRQPLRADGQVTIGAPIPNVSVYI